MKRLPPGWTTEPIGGLCDLNPKHNSDTPLDQLVSFVPMAAVSDVSGSIESAEQRTFGEVRRGFTHFADGDVIWAKITPCMENGKSAVAEDLINGMACGSTEFMVFRSRGAILPTLLHRYMRQESYRRAARRTMKSGVGQARVPKEFVLNSVVPVAPINEQKRIAAKLEALQLRTDAAKEALDAIPPLLEKFRQSVLAAAFRGDLTKAWRARNPDVEPATELLARIRAERRARWVEDAAEKARAKAEAKARKAGARWSDADDARVLEAARAKAAKKYVEPEPVDAAGLPALPGGWCWATTAELVEPGTIITYGVVKPGPEDSDGVPYVRGRDVQDGTILADQLRRMSPTLAATKPHSQLEDGDIVLCIIRHLRVAVVPSGLSGANLTQGAVRMRPSFALRGDYLRFWLESPVCQAWMKALHFGIAMPRINVEDTRRVPVPLAPVQEQKALAMRVDEVLERCSAFSSAFTDAFAARSALEGSILAKAFRGELVPQDPDDEPASVLLERIRAERAATGARGGKAEVSGRHKKKRAAVPPVQAPLPGLED